MRVDVTNALPAQVDALEKLLRTTKGLLNKFTPEKVRPFISILKAF